MQKEREQKVERGGEEGGTAERTGWTRTGVGGAEEKGGGEGEEESKLIWRGRRAGWKGDKEIWRI